MNERGAIDWFRNSNKESYSFSSQEKDKTQIALNMVNTGYEWYRPILQELWSTDHPVIMSVYNWLFWDKGFA